MRLEPKWPRGQRLKANRSETQRKLFLHPTVFGIIVTATPLRSVLYNNDSSNNKQPPPSHMRFHFRDVAGLMKWSAVRGPGAAV